jgi:putative ATP-binding cassette transporter
MKSKLVELLIRGSTPELRRNIIVTDAMSGVASAAILAIINAAAHSVEVGDLNFRYFAMFVIVIATYIYCLRYTFDRTTRTLEKILDGTRNRIADKIRHSELISIDQIGRAQIYGRLTQDTAILSQLEYYLASGIQSAAMVLFISLYIISLSTYAFFVTVLLLVGGLAIYLRNDRRLNKNFEYTSLKEAELFDRVTHLIDGFQQVRLNQERSDDLYTDTVEVSGAVRDSKIAMARSYNEKYILSQVFFYANLGAIVFVLPQIVPTYSETITQVTVAIVFFVGPLTSLVSSIPAYNKGNMAAEHIAMLENKLDELRNPPPDDSIQISSFSQINLADVEFSYAGSNTDRFSMGPLSLEINAGEILFICGGNGSGKSTLLRILTSLYLPKQGRLSVDGMTIDAETMHAYRSLFSIVFSDFHLFDKLYGLRDVDPERVKELLVRMHLDSKTAYVDGRFTSLDLSTGQRKRMALLVALLEDRQVYVLDEWAAEQDPEFRAYFYEELIHDLRASGKTVIAVSHDDRYFHHADRIVKMELGSVVEEDSAPPVPS